MRDWNYCCDWRLRKNPKRPRPTPNNKMVPGIGTFAAFRCVLAKEFPLNEPSLAEPTRELLETKESPLVAAASKVGMSESPVDAGLPRSVTEICPAVSPPLPPSKPKRSSSKLVPLRKKRLAKSFSSELFSPTILLKAIPPAPPAISALGLCGSILGMLRALSE